MFSPTKEEAHRLAGLAACCENDLEAAATYAGLGIDDVSARFRTRAESYSRDAFNLAKRVAERSK